MIIGCLNYIQQVLDTWPVKWCMLGVGKAQANLFAVVCHVDIPTKGSLHLTFEDGNHCIPYAFPMLGRQGSEPYKGHSMERQCLWEMHLAAIAGPEQIGFRASCCQMGQLGAALQRRLLIL